MDPEGTSRDDLDVRLDWPGAEPEGAADTDRLNALNGAPGGAPLGDQGSPRPPVARQGVPIPQELEFETLRATLALMSVRLDALAAAVEASHLSYNSFAAAIERLDRSVSALAKTSEGSGAQVMALSAEISETLHRLADDHRDQFARVTDLLAEVKALTSDKPDPAPGDRVSEQLEAMTRQIEALRRRITLRGRDDQFSLDETIELIAGAVVERLSGAIAEGRSSPPRRRQRER